MGALVKVATAWERFILHDLTTFARYAKVGADSYSLKNDTFYVYLSYFSRKVVLNFFGQFWIRSKEPFVKES
jgi:hypothetical protein